MIVSSPIHPDQIIPSKFATVLCLSCINLSIKLSDKIHREESKFEIDIVKINQGRKVKTQKTSYKRLDECIELLVSAYDSTQLDQYLKNIAANISV